MIQVVKFIKQQIKPLRIFLGGLILFALKTSLINTNHVQVIGNAVVLDQKAWQALYHSAKVSFNADLEVMSDMLTEDFAPYCDPNVDLNEVKARALETTRSWLAQLEKIVYENKKTNRVVIMDLKLFIRSAESMLCTLQKKYHIKIRQKFYLGNYEPQVNAFVDFVNKLTNDEYGHSLASIQQSFSIEGFLHSIRVALI